MFAQLDQHGLVQLGQDAIGPPLSEGMNGGSSGSRLHQSSSLIGLLAMSANVPRQRQIEYEGTSHFRVTASSATIGVLEVNLNHYGRGSLMRNITRVGVDLAKNLIQVQAVDAAGKVVTSRALKREKFLVWFGLPKDIVTQAWGYLPVDMRRVISDLYRLGEESKSHVVMCGVVRLREPASAGQGDLPSAMWPFEASKPAAAAPSS